ncbi:MAG: hypothetical protein S4CHLAM45_02830 [Chlamydiales bacterium]|nr:hypothetical protein [Chlamydiales bacterium]MCH9619141.1 hypothetical protein [Chlamydiales bacterium]MCH9622403.1 hypothetical protein [Chlamydiales bacterium]
MAINPVRCFAQTARKTAEKPIEGFRWTVHKTALQIFAGADYVPSSSSLPIGVERAISRASQVIIGKAPYYPLKDGNGTDDKVIDCAMDHRVPVNYLQSNTSKLPNHLDLNYLETLSSQAFDAVQTGDLPKMEKIATLYPRELKDVWKTHAQLYTSRILCECKKNPSSFVYLSAPLAVGPGGVIERLKNEGYPCTLMSKNLLVEP